MSCVTFFLFDANFSPLLLLLLQQDSIMQFADQLF